MFRSGVIGSPVGHSLSPRLHEAAFQHLGVEGVSSPIEVTATDFDAIDQAMGLDAFSITTPMKEAMLAYCSPSPRARVIGAVNSIRHTNNAIEGDNFDGEGFHRAIMYQLDVDIRNEIACVYGSGPAARSIVEALLRHGVGGVEVVVRRSVPSHEVFRDKRVNVTERPLITADLVVNATSLGLNGETPHLAPAKVDTHTAYVDVAYAPSETAWMKEMRQTSNRVANGLHMLLWQAKLQIEWWFDATLPIEVLLAAVES
jgi:shikimate dehydrogenase